MVAAEVSPIENVVGPDPFNAGEGHCLTLVHAEAEAVTAYLKRMGLLKKVSSTS